jgi:hypothetical protein
MVQQKRNLSQTDISFIGTIGLGRSLHSIDHWLQACPSGYSSVALLKPIKLAMQGGRDIIISIHNHLLLGPG